MAVRQKIKEQYTIYLSVCLYSISIHFYLPRMSVCLSVCLPAYHYLFFRPMELILDSLDSCSLCIKGWP